MQIRGEPFFPWDIYQIKEAAGISSEMDLVFTPRLWVSIAVVIIVVLGAVVIDVFYRYPKKIRYWYRLGAGLLCAALIQLTVGHFVFDDAVREKHEVEFLAWNEKVTYEKAGVLYAFIENIENMLIEAPDGYGKKSVLDIAKDYKSESAREPNVIIIMSEAFTDPDIYRTLEFEEDLTPNLDRIAKKYLSGRLLTQSFGGGTSISENEVLTGCSAQFYPSSAVPYMQYVTRETDTYASFLKKLGYSAVAVHPFKRSYWNRDKAYPLLGFEEFYDIDTFPEKPRNRFISDMDLKDKIIELYENRESDKIFIFAVSMQNHYAYYPNEYGDITVKMKDNEASALLTDEQKAKICTYAMGVKLADEALGALVDYFETKKSRW